MFLLHSSPNIVLGRGHRDCHIIRANVAKGPRVSNAPRNHFIVKSHRYMRPRTTFHQRLSESGRVGACRHCFHQTISKLILKRHLNNNVIGALVWNAPSCIAQAKSPFSCPRIDETPPKYNLRTSPSFPSRSML